MTGDIPDEAVEAAARAMCAFAVCDFDNPEQQAVIEWTIESKYYLDYARVAVPAAYPSLLAEIAKLREALRAIRALTTWREFVLNSNNIIDAALGPQDG